jgi:hypothetical protein
MIKRGMTNKVVSLQVTEERMEERVLPGASSWAQFSERSVRRKSDNLQPALCPTQGTPHSTASGTQ